MPPSLEREALNHETILLPAECEWKKLPLGAIDAFVLSQVDGRMTLEDIAEIAGIDLATALDLAKRLLDLGAVSASDRPPPKSGRKSSAPAASRSSRRPARLDARAEKDSVPPTHREARDPRVDKVSARPARLDSRVEKHSARPRPVEIRTEKQAPRAIARRASSKSLKAARSKPEVCELDEATHAAIVSYEAKLTTHDHYALLGVERGAEKKDIKRAYYALAAKFHPDRFFGKKLGDARAPLDRVFHRLTEAHDVLTDRVKRAEYDKKLPASSKPPPARASSSPAAKARTVPPRRQSKALKAASVTPPKKSAPPKKATTHPPRETAEIPPIAPPPVVNVAPVSDVSMRKLVAVARRIDVQRRIELFVKAAEDAMKADDVIGAANNYRLALQLGEDSYLRAKLEDVDDVARTRRRDLNMKRARAAERAEKWSDAAMFFVKAFDARAEAGIAERAAYSLRMSNGDLTQAASLAEKAIAMEPKNAEHWVTRGEIHLASGALTEAANSSAKALEIAPKDPRAMELAAMVQRAKKKK